MVHTIHCLTNKKIVIAKHANRRDKLKFTHVASRHLSYKTAFLKDINSGLEQEEKTLTKYWQTGELQQLKNKTNSLKILHLNISSIKYHFAGFLDVLTTFGIQSKD